jgi:hypothetical protein
MKIRLLGRSIKTHTSVRYLVEVGGRRGGVTYSQYRLLEILAHARIRKRPADLAHHYGPNNAAQLVSRTRNRLRQINPRLPNPGIIPKTPGFYHATFFIQLPKRHAITADSLS